eukprot:g9751.t1
MNLRRYAGPFDWIYTTAQLVRHCIEDDFECFLDLEQLYRHGQAWGHRRYCQMLKRQILFPHHRPADRDREHFQRTVQRWRQVVASEEKKLFVFMPLVQSKKELQSVRDRESMHGSNLQQVEELLRSLRQRVGNFELLVVYVVEGSSRWRQGATEDTELDTTREILQQPELRDPRLKKNFGRESSEPRRRAKNVEQLPSKGKRKAQADERSTPEVYNNEHGIQIHFPLALFKMLKGESLSLADLQDDTFCLTFSASYDYFGEMKHVDLKPGGDLPVTYDTRKEYVELYCRWRLETSTERQFKLLAQGFEKVVDSAREAQADASEEAPDLWAQARVYRVILLLFLDLFTDAMGVVQYVFTGNLSFAVISAAILGTFLVQQVRGGGGWFRFKEESLESLKVGKVTDGLQITSLSQQLVVAPLQLFLQSYSVEFVSSSSLVLVSLSLSMLLSLVSVADAAYTLLELDLMLHIRRLR